MSNAMQAQGSEKLHEMPLDVHFNILSYLPFKEKINSVFRVSKHMSEVVLQELARGKKNSLDCLITGMDKAGTSTLFWLLSQESHKKTHIQLDKSQDVSSVATPPLPVHKQGMQYTNRIRISDCRTAIIFHGPTNPARRKQMFSYFGISQCVVFVIPAQNPADEQERIAFKKELTAVILPAYALSGHLNWIFAVNKMDLVQYSETEFNKVVALTNEILAKISSHIAEKVTFVPISATEAQNLHNFNGETTSLMPWYTGGTLTEKMNAIASGLVVPLYKYLRRPSLIAIETKNWLTAEEKKNNPDKISHLIQGYLIDGLFGADSKLYVEPHGALRKLSKNTVAPTLTIGFNVASIKSFDTFQQGAVAGNFIGVNLRLEASKNQTPADTAALQLINRWRRYYATKINASPLNLTPKYHRLTTRDKPIHMQFSCQVQMVAVGSKAGSWNGEITPGLSAAFYTQGARTMCSIEKIVAVTTKKGFAVNEPKAVLKGQKATVDLKFNFPLELRVYKKNLAHGNYPNTDGRFLLYLQRQVVAMGIVSTLEPYKPRKWLCY